MHQFLQTIDPDHVVAALCVAIGVIGLAWSVTLGYLTRKKK